MWYHFLTNDIPAAIFHLLFPFPDHPLLIFYFIFFIFYFIFRFRADTSHWRPSAPPSSPPAPSHMHRGQ